MGVDIAVRPGETLIEAAWRAGYYWPTVCFGQADCLSCRVLVVGRAENLADVGPEESKALLRLRRRATAVDARVTRRRSSDR